MSGFRCLIPAAPAIPAPAAKQQNNKHDDEKRGGIHGRTPPVPCVFSHFAYALPLQPTFLIPIRSYANGPGAARGRARRGHLGKRRGAALRRFGCEEITPSWDALSSFAHFPNLPQASFHTAWIKPGPPPWGPTFASAECRHWSGRAVRWSSCAILLRRLVLLNHHHHSPYNAQQDGATNTVLSLDTATLHGGQDAR